MTALVLLTGCVGIVEPKQGAERTSSTNDNATETPVKLRDAGTDEDPDLDDDQDFANNEPPVQLDAGDKAASSQGCNATEDFPLAQGLHLRELALYQTVKIPLYSDGAWIEDRVAPVVQNKKALVRAFVEPMDGYRSHDVRAVLKLVNGSDVQELLDERTIASASTDLQLTSTFSFQLEPGEVGPDTQISLTLIETNCGAESGAPADARMPAGGGMQALDATLINKLKLVVVPVNVDGRVPVTTDKELANMRSALLAYYPVPDVEISVREAISWSAGVDALDGNSWSDLLNQIMRTRRSDGPASNVYYFGLIQPAATFRAYCQKGCVLGLAPQATQVMANAQVGLGASFADAQTYETMVHELGHAHGRGHAPCVEAGEIDGVDEDFPDATGATATWGWDSRSNTLMPPTDKDIMGYCEPNWIGSYNYAGIAKRSQAVNLKALRLPAPTPWLNVMLYDDGRARWGGDSDYEQPAGESELATVLDASGATIDHVEVVRMTLSHAGTQFLYVPSPGANWSALRLNDRTLTLANVLPAL